MKKVTHDWGAERARRRMERLRHAPLRELTAAELEEAQARALIEPEFYEVEKRRRERADLRREGGDESGLAGVPSSVGHSRDLPERLADLQKQARRSK